jgi:hypothetical protein
MVRGQLLKAILSQRFQQVKKDLGLEQEVDENDSQRENFKDCRVKEEI